MENRSDEEISDGPDQIGCRGTVSKVTDEIDAHPPNKRQRTIKSITITSVDIGVLHLAFTYARINVETSVWRVEEILQKKMINIKDFGCDLLTCPLYHGKCVTDYLRHLVNRESCFKDCNELIIERQPPQGLQNVQEFFINEFRDKVELIPPRSMQKWYHIHNFVGTEEERRDQRKIASENIATKLLVPFEHTLDGLERKHDVADSVLQLFYYLVRENIKRNPGRSKYFL